MWKRAGFLLRSALDDAGAGSFELGDASELHELRAVLLVGEGGEHGCGAVDGRIQCGLRWWKLCDEGGDRARDEEGEDDARRLNAGRHWWAFA